MKLTVGLIAKIAKVVRSGCYLDAAARFCGVSKASYYAWMKRGHDQKDGIYRQFLEALEQAQAAADVRDHRRISEASAKDWRAAVTHLRLRNPGRYSQRTELTGPEGGPITTNVEASLLDLFNRLVADDSEAECDKSKRDPTCGPGFPEPPNPSRNR
jgi:hypothetical protein